MAYTGQIVIYLDDDLEPTARAIANKVGNTTVSWSRYSGTNTQLPAQALAGVVANFRLVIVGHGDPGSTSIGNRDISPERLAQVVNVWLSGVRISRISLHMCFGGGNRGTATGHNSAQFTVRPQSSFAFKFASYCGQLAVDITARTDTVAGFSGGEKGFTRTVGGRKSAEGDKLIFTTNVQSTLAAPLDPTMQFVWG